MTQILTSVWLLDHKYDVLTTAAINAIKIHNKDISFGSGIIVCVTCIWCIGVLFKSIWS